MNNIFFFDNMLLYKQRWESYMEEKILEIVKVSRNNGLTKQEVYKKLA